MAVTLEPRTYVAQIELRYAAEHDDAVDRYIRHKLLPFLDRGHRQFDWEGIDYRVDWPPVRIEVTGTHG
jgi:hypothetical protein